MLNIHWFQLFLFLCDNKIQYLWDNYSLDSLEDNTVWRFWSSGNRDGVKFILLIIFINKSSSETRNFRISYLNCFLWFPVLALYVRSWKQFCVFAL